MVKTSKSNQLIFLLYALLFFTGIRALFHGFPDIERFFFEWRDERLALTYIMKFGTLNFAPTQIWHPPLYHYLTFIPVSLFYLIGKLIGIFQDKIEFVRFYFDNTQYFLFIGRMTSYIFYWLAAVMVFKVSRLFYNRTVSHITTWSYLLVPRFILDYATAKPGTLTLLISAIFFYFFLKYYLENKRRHLFLAAFFLGVACATKYNTLFLGVMFIPLLVFQLNKRIISNFKEILTLSLKSGLLIFLGFFICNPFFIIQFSKYFHNLMVFSTVEMRYYWLGHHPAVFCITHLRGLMSFVFINPFGFLVLAFGGWHLLKKDKRLLAISFTGLLLFEIYFGIILSNTSPMRYLYPLLPIAALLYASGVDFIINKKGRLSPILILFAAVSIYNYLDIWQGISQRPTSLQKARYFIEENIPEFTTIAITTRSYLPQLSMTRSSYWHLLDTAPTTEQVAGHELDYKPMDDNARYHGMLREMRIASMTKSPQYNLLRWDKDINTEKEALQFLRKNKVKYIIGVDISLIGNKKLSDTKMLALVKQFKADNKRVYETPDLYIFKVK